MGFRGLAPSNQTICQVGKYEGLIYASQSTEWNEMSKTRYYSDNFTNLHGDIVIYFQGKWL